MNRRNPDLTEAWLRKYEVETKNPYLKQLCRQKRAQNEDRRVEPRQQYVNRPRTLHDMNRRRS